MKRTLFLFLLYLLGTGCTDSTTLSISTSCGAAVVAAAADPSTADNVQHRAEVAVHVALSSALQVDVQGTLRVTLTRDGSAAAPVAPLVRELQGVLPAGTSAADVWFPISEVSVSEHVLVELVPAGSVDPSMTVEQDVRFECVAACPAHHVMVQIAQPIRECPHVTATGGSWRDALAAVDATSSYCEYHWQPEGSSSAPPDLSVFAGAVWQVDCPVVVAQQNVVQPPPAAPITPEELALATQRRLGIDQLDASAAWPPSSARPVWLGLVDTAVHPFTDGRSFQNAGRDNSEHGRLMGLVAQHTACGKAPFCPIEVHNMLGLPLVAADAPPDEKNGGFFGTRGQLAAALHRLLDDWQAAAPNGEIPLVINLSVGWHSKHDCGDGPSADTSFDQGCGAPIQQDQPSVLRTPLPLGADPGGLSSSLGSAAVLVELMRARCLGALVFAAAGNAVGGDDHGALLPAGWNQRSLVGGQCKRALGIGVTDPPGTLVSAVGGVDPLGRPLALTRQGSLPRFVALGAGVSALDAEDLRNGDPGWTGVDGPLSGTSLATAVVSGAAARLWSELNAAPPGPTPGLRSLPTAADVERELYNAADALRLEVQLCAGTASCGMFSHEVSACTALRALGVSSCRVRRVLPVQAGPAPMPAAADQVTCASPEDPAAGVMDPALPRCPPLEAERVDELEAPWVFPQPSGVSCTTCSQRLLNVTADGLSGTQFTVSLTDALLNDRSTRLTAARLRAGGSSAALSNSLLVGDRTISTLSSTGAAFNRPINWSVYGANVGSTPATLEVDRTNLQGTPLDGVAGTEIPQLR